MTKAYSKTKHSRVQLKTAEVTRLSFFYSTITEERTQIS